MTNHSYCLPGADKIKLKDARDRDAVVTGKSKRGTDVDTDKNSSLAVWKPEDKPGRIHLTRRLAQCELAGHNHDSFLHSWGTSMRQDSLETTMRLLVGLPLATACPSKREWLEELKQEARQEAIPFVCTSDAAFVGFVGVDKTGPSLTVRAGVSDW